MKPLLFILTFLIPWQQLLAQWFPQNTGVTKNLNSVFFSNQNVGYIVGDSGTILKTTNGGQDWQNNNSNTFNSLRSVCFTSTDTGYIVGANGIILKTTDGGDHWIVQNSGITDWLYSVYFPSKNTGYACGGGWNGIILKTVDGGNNWTNLNLGSYTYIRFFSLNFLNENLGYVVGQFLISNLDGYILKTTNGGIDWVEQNSPGSYPGLNSIYFSDSITGHVVGSYGTILATTTGGSAWTTQVSGTNEFLSSTFFIDCCIGYAVGGNGTILKTTDGGNIWNSQSSGTFDYLSSIQFTSSDTGYTVGGNGVFLRTFDGGTPIGINDLSNNSSDFKIYPNPSTGIIIIQSLPGVESFLSILDCNDQELINQKLSEPNTEIDCSKIPKGLYFIRLITKDKSKFKKLIME